MTTRSPASKPAAKQPASLIGANIRSTTQGSKTTGKRVGLAIKKLSPRSFTLYNTMDIAEKIRTIRSGLPAQRVGELSSAMNISKEALMDSLGLSRATINRKAQREQVLSPEESERVMGMQVLIGQVHAMIDPESAPDFDAAKWLAAWLAAPLPALGGATPASFMDTVEGQKFVGNLLEMAQSGAYA